MAPPVARPKQLRTKWSISSLRRVTSSGSYIAEIDGLRFVAIISVLAYHQRMMSSISTGFAGDIGIGAILIRFFSYGGRGVDLFFVISGLVLGLPFARYRLLGQAPVRLKAYFLRRVTRLEPPYIANLLLRLPLVVVVKHLTMRQASLHLVTSLFYADWLVYRTMPVIHPPSWSLAIEIQFYLLAPLLALAVFHENCWARRIVSAVSILLCSLAAPHLPGVLQLSLLRFAQLFLTGMLAADLYLTVLPKVRRSILWDVVAIPLWALVFWLPDSWANYLLSPLLLFLVLAAFLGPSLRAFFSTPWVAVIGGMCYSIYLTHSLTLQIADAILKRLMPHAGFWQFFIVSLLVVTPVLIAVGAVFFVLVERPCMDKNWPAKLWAKLHDRFREPVSSQA
jgi:peptidoglycan/LPS O-acetylase OafA/YrhL